MITASIQSSAVTRIISPTDLYWQQFLNTIPHDFYHLPGYLELEAKRQNATAEAIIIDDGEKVFFLPYLIRDCDLRPDGYRSSHSGIYDVISPYGYPGMLVNQPGQNPEFIRKCFDLIQICWQDRNICSAFLRLHPILNSYIDTSLVDRADFSICDRGNVVICDLTNDINNLHKQMRESHRTKINKLRRAGFTTRIEPMDKYLDIFIDIYFETMDRVNASQIYYFKRDYFENLSQILGERVNICLVETDDQIVAASLITEMSGIVQYHLGGTRTNYLPKSPTTIMFDHIIKWAKQRNNTYLNLGGGLGGGKDSLYHFKSGFSDRSKTFTTIQAVVDRTLYDRLTCLRAEFLGITVAQMQDTSFFPTYRSH
jgi:hypothetical protein